MSSVKENVERCLCAVLCASRKPGIRLEKLAKLSGAGTAGQMRRDLELLTLVGTPPFGPGDLLEAEVTPAGRVFLHRAERLLRRDVLTLPETLALIAGASLNLSGEGPENGNEALTSAAAELTALSPAVFRPMLRRAGRAFVRRPSGGEAHLCAARRAIQLKRPAAVEMLRPGRAQAANETETENVLLRPEFLRERGGAWVLKGCDQTGQMRALDLTFVRSLTPAEENFAPLSPQPPLRAVIACADAFAARALASSASVLSSRISRRRQGWLRVSVELSADDAAPLAGLVVSLAGRAVVRSPDSLRNMVLDLAASVAAGWP